MNNITIAFSVILMASGAYAQLPGVDNGNHKEKPEVKESTETIAAYNVPIEEYVPRVIIEGKWGTGPGEFGVAWTDANDISVPQSPSGSKSMPIYPSSLAVDGKGNIYVLDMVNNRIQKFDPQGIFLKTLDVESYMGEEQPIWYGKVKTEDGREILDKVDSKDKSGNTTGTDKWFPFYWPITVQGINIVIDSKDTLYYYLKRVKDGKETGEVWEFRNDKLIKKIKQGEEKPDKGYKTFEVHKDSNKNTEILVHFENNKSLRFNPRLGRKIKGAFSTDIGLQNPIFTKDLVIFLSFRKKSTKPSDFGLTDETTYIYDKKGTLKNIVAGFVPGEVDNKGNGYVMNTNDNGIVVTKYEKVRASK